MLKVRKQVSDLIKDLFFGVTCGAVWEFKKNTPTWEVSLLCWLFRDKAVQNTLRRNIKIKFRRVKIVRMKVAVTTCSYAPSFSWRYELPHSLNVWLSSRFSLIEPSLRVRPLKNKCVQNNHHANFKFTAKKIIWLTKFEAFFDIWFLYFKNKRYKPLKKRIISFVK